MLHTFLQYPITFNHKSLQTDQLGSQIQSSLSSVSQIKWHTHSYQNPT